MSDTSCTEQLRDLGHEMTYSVVGGQVQITVRAGAQTATAMASTAEEAATAVLPVVQTAFPPVPVPVIEPPVEEPPVEQPVPDPVPEPEPEPAPDPAPEPDPVPEDPAPEQPAEPTGDPAPDPPIDDPAPTEDAGTLPA